MKIQTTFKDLSFTGAALAVSLLAAQVNAACTNNAATNKATIVFNQPVLATMKGVLNQPSADVNGSRYVYLNKFLADNLFKYPASGNTGCLASGAQTPANKLCNNSPIIAPNTTNAQEGNDQTLSTVAYNQTLPVVCSLTAAPTYQTGNVVTTWNNVGDGKKIGLAGAYKVRSNFQNPTTSIRWGRLSLYNSVLGSTAVGVYNTPATAGNWELRDEWGRLFQLTEITKTITAAPNKIRLQANLKIDNPVSTSGSIPGACTNGIAPNPATGADWCQFWRKLAPYDTGIFATNILQMTAAETLTSVGTIDLTLNY